MLQLNECVKSVSYCWPAFGSPISATEARRGDAPGTVAIEAFIVAQIGLLEALITAMGADAAGVDPISVAVEAILHMVFIDRDAEICCQCFGLFPRGNFHH